MKQLTDLDCEGRATITLPKGFGKRQGKTLTVKLITPALGGTIGKRAKLTNRVIPVTKIHSALEEVSFSVEIVKGKVPDLP
jgi:hypothetical protein